MKKFITIFFILIISIIFIFCIISLRKIYVPKYMLNNSPYSPNRKGEFGISFNNLAQSTPFYEKNKDSTLNYLKGVYPLGYDSFTKLTSLQLASFFNSLTFYYNCQFEYQDNDLGSLPDKFISGKWSALPCAKNFPLPYPPQGYFYNFYTYQKYNIPYVYSDSNENTVYLNLKNFGNCRPGLNFNTYKKGKENSLRAGPGMFWVNCRSIQRHIWFPNGFVNKKEKFEDKDNWKININKSLKWNYPRNWYNGFNSNEYIEVTHFSYGPGGMTTSPGWWFNCFCGTGLFLFLGKTKNALNKIDGAFELIKEMYKTKDGPAILKKYFDSDDAYEIIWKLQTGDCKEQNKYCASILNCCESGGADGEKGIPFEADILNTNSFYKETIRYQNEHGIKDTTPTKEGIKMAIDAATKLKDFNLARFSVNIVCDEPMFFLGTLLGYDTIQLRMSSNSNGYYVYELIDLRMPVKYLTALKNRDYSEIIDIKQSYNNYNKWNETFLKDTIDYLINGKFITLRDPLDIYNENKVQKCLGPNLNTAICDKNHPGEWNNLYCEQASLSNEYKCLGIDSFFSTCNLIGDNPTC